jgi:glycosyltransferase involved in cell wall biosynthesis
MDHQQPILIINYEYPPLGGGGGHASAQIAARLVKRGHRVHVLTSRFHGFKKHEVIDGVHIYRIPTLRRHQEKCSVFEMMVFIVMSVLLAGFYAKRIKPSYVLSFFSIPSSPAAYVIRLFLNIPYVIALRGGDVPGFLPEQLSKFHSLSNWLTRILWRNAAKITANSEGLADLARRFYPGKKIEVIPNGVDACFFSQRETVSTKDELTLLTVGRVSRQKNIERLVAVMKRLKDLHPGKFKLKIVGDGPERDRIEQLVADAKLEGEISFCGWIAREELPRYYQQADIFVLASDFEGMPNVMLEAMASSLAIVATEAPGTVDLVEPERNGFLVSKQRLEAFDEAVLRMKEDSRYLLKLQQSSYAIAQKYTWDNVTEAYEKLLDV